MRDNGLTAATYVSMGGIDPLVAEPVLAALAEAGIAAYAAAPGEDQSLEAERAGDGPGERPTEPSAEATATEPAPTQPAPIQPASTLPASTEAPAAEVPAAEAHAPEAHTTEAHITEAATTEAPTTAVPAAKSPTAEGTATDSAAAEPGATEAPATEAPAAEAPAEGLAAAAATTAPAGAPAAAGVRSGREEIFVDAGSAERARAVILRSTEDAEWKALVEQFNAPPAPGRGDSPVPRWPASEDVDVAGYEPLIDVPSGLDEQPDTEAEEAEAEEAAAAKRRAARANDPHDHFVPPEPPRGPRLDWISRAAWLGVIGGPLLLVLAAIFGFGESRVTQLAVVGFVGGFLTLVFRMKDRLPGDDSGDDGAVV